MSSNDKAKQIVEDKKTELMIKIVAVINLKRFTQGEAAFIAKTTQPQISRVVNGKLKGVTIEFLMITLSRLEQ